MVLAAAWRGSVGEFSDSAIAHGVVSRSPEPELAQTSGRQAGA